MQIFKSSISGQLTLMTCFTLVLLMLSFSAEATRCRFETTVDQTGGVSDPLNTIGESYSGTDICPQNPAAGCDFSSTDNIVRTHDIVVYKFAYNIRAGDADNVTITAALPLGYVWDSMPGYCGAGTGTGTPSSLTGDGVATPSIMICNIGSETSGAAVDLLFSARVLGDRQDGDSFSVSSGLTADDAEDGDSCDEKAASEEVFVTAAPRFNIKKRNYSYYPYTHNGEKGVRLVYKYRIGTIDTPLSGNAATDPAQPLTWLDDVSGISPNAELIACAAVRHGNGEPYHSLAVAPAGSENRAVTDSGTLSCTQTGGAGTPISMTVTGADTTLSHYPSLTRGGSAISVTEKIAAIGRIYIFVPLQEVLDAPGRTLDAENCMTEFDPASAAGVSNFGDLSESEHDNCTNMAVIAGGYGWSKYFREKPNVYTPPTTAAAVGSGDGVVAPGQTWSTLLAFYNRGVIDRPNVATCDVIDLNSFQFEPLPAGTSFQISDVATLRTNNYTGGVVVEYASGYVGAWPPPAGSSTAINTECNDPSVVWNSSFAAAGGSAAVTKLRIRFTDDVPSGTYVYAWVHHKALDNGNPNGHILENQASLYLDEIPSGRACSYDQGTYPGGHRFVNCGDRLILTRELARVEKKTDDPAVPGIDDSVNASVSGGQVKFWLVPSVTAIASAPASTTVTITDVLPLYMNYISANPAPSSVLPNTPSAGQTTLIWTIPGFTPNTPIPPIELDVEIDLDAPPGVLNNEVCIASTNDGSEERLRCDNRGINISVPAGLRVRKKVDLTYIDHDGTIEYELLWRNNSPSDITEMVIIDVLPIPGLGNNPTNAFSGTLNLLNPLTAPGLPPGISVEYTKTPGLSVSSDPTVASNLPGGSTIWCSVTPTPAAPATCPRGFAGVTAMRFTDSTLLPSFSPSRSLFFKVKTNGNLTGDLYQNQFGGKAKETTLPVRSNKVVTVVLGVALGGIVFDDPENDGDLDSGAGVFSGVPVELYETGKIPGTDLPLATTTTDPAGNYLFDFLEPGNYFVFIPATGFPVDRLSSFRGVAANGLGDDADDDDDQVDDGQLVQNIVGHTDGVRSADINLSEHFEPLLEVAPNLPSIHEDDRVNYTIDFGFTGKVAIGNRVWNDDGAGGGGANNGILDGTEVPIDGVTVDLYKSTIAVLGSPFRTTVTAGGGYYEFDNLRQGEYFVRIRTSNFAAGAPLDGLLSSSGAGGDDGIDEDADENGLDAMVAGGVNSANIDLRDGFEIVSEDQTNYSGTLDDENVDFTVDFGFVEPASIGSLVWDDSDGDGQQDPGEDGLAGICVSLMSAGPDGITGNADDVIVQTQTTSDGTQDVDNDGTVDPIGYYYFHQVMPGSYYVDFGCLPPSAAWSPSGSTGNPADDSNVGPGGSTPPFTLGPGDNNSTVDGGLYNPTTPVQFSMVHVDGDRNASQATFSFQTSIEDGTVGFNFYARKSGEWVKLNDSLVPARAADSGDDGAYYTESVYGAFAEEFAITEVDTFSNETVHGPYDASVTYGRRLAAEPVASDANDATDRSQQQLSNALYRKPTGDPVNSLWLLTRGSGINRIYHAALVEAGLDLTGVDSNSIAITLRGKSIARYIGNAESGFGRGSFVEFLARDVDSLYASRNVYEIAVDAANAVDATATRSKVENPTGVATKTIHLEKDRYYSRLAPTADPWYMDRILTTDRKRSKRYYFDVDDVVNDKASLRVSLWGATDDPLSPRDHHVEIFINERKVADRVFDGVKGVVVKGQIPAGLLRSGRNIIEVRVPNDRGTKFDLVYVDQIDIDYPGRLALSKGQLRFKGDGSSYRIKNVTTPNTSIWSRGSNGDRFHEASIGGGTARIGADGTARNFFVSTRVKIKSPLLAQAVVADRSAVPADYLVITHPAFNNEVLDRLVMQRQADGFSTDVVDVSEIYAAHSGGVVDPQAIKDYIRRSASERGTSLVLLVGDDSYDPFNRLGNSSKSYLPTLYTSSDKTIRWSPSDSLLADIDDDGIQDLAIGRFPVSTTAALQAVVDKTLMYAQTATPGSVIMAADSTDDASLYSFKRDSEKLIRALGGAWSVHRAFLDDAKVSRLRNSIIKGINDGVSLVNFMGHSDLNTWSFDGLLRGEDLFRLTNSGAPTVALQWGCWNTYFVEPSKQVLGVDMLTQADSGAAAVLGASSLVRASSERELGRLLYQRISVGELTIGEAIAESKQVLAKRYPGVMSDIQVNFNLLGDPALRIPVPESDLNLNLDVTVDGQFGTRFGDGDNDGSLTTTFEGTDQDLLLSLQGFDIDDSREVDVYLNGRRIGSLKRGQNNRLNRGDLFLIRAQQQRPGTNIVEFRHRDPGRRWGVTELKLSSDNQPQIELAVGKRDAGEYGYRYGSNLNPASLKANFPGTGKDLQLVSTGYDISEKEVAVYLNDNLLGYLRHGEKGETVAGNRFYIPVWKQRAENTIEFRPGTVGRTWGVTKILLKDINRSALNLALDQTLAGKHGYGYGNRKTDYPVSMRTRWLGTITGLKLNLRGFDIGKREVRVFLNGNFVEFLSATPAGKTRQLNPVRLPMRYQNAGENVLEFRPVKPESKWGVSGLTLGSVNQQSSRHRDIHTSERLTLEELGILIDE